MYLLSSNNFKASVPVKIALVACSTRVPFMYLASSYGDIGAFFRPLLLLQFAWILMPSQMSLCFKVVYKATWSEYLLKSY